MHILHFSLFFLLVSDILAAKILYLGFPFYSHLQSLATVASSMNKRGHESWLASPPGLDVKLNLKARNIRTLPFSKGQLLEHQVDHLLGSDLETSPFEEYWRTGKFPLRIEPFLDTVHTMLTDEVFMATIKQQGFDMVILDNTPIAQMLYIIPYKYDIPFISLGVNYDPYVQRIPFSTSFLAYMGEAYTDQLNFVERLQNTLTLSFIVLFNPFSYRNAASIYAPEKPYLDVIELQRKASLVLVEWNYLLIYPCPTMPHVVQIGQVVNQDSGGLSSEFEDFLSRAQHGVVLVSFGSLAPTTSNPVLDKLVSAFKNTKYSFIIKGKYASSTDQMLVADWIPQQALLKHHKIKLFVTHCGANGIFEAIANAVPMLGFPIFADQPGNALRLSARGYGLSMDLVKAMESDITSNIKELIENPKYKNSVKRASEILKVRQTNGTKDAVFWIEHVLEFGSDYLKSASITMPWYQYVLLDVIFFICMCVASVVLAAYICLRKIYRCSRRSKAKNE